jgi:hypothetical protein
MTKNPRIALYVLIGWSAVIGAIVIGLALADPSGPISTGAASSVSEHDLQLVGAVIGGFAVWFLGLMTIALVTIVVRLGHVTKALQS